MERWKSNTKMGPSSLKRRRWEKTTFNCAKNMKEKWSIGNHTGRASLRYLNKRRKSVVFGTMASFFKAKRIGWRKNGFMKVLWNSIRLWMERVSAKFLRIKSYIKSKVSFKMISSQYMERRPLKTLIKMGSTMELWTLKTGIEVAKVSSITTMKIKAST